MAQVNQIHFQLLNSSGVPVTGLGNTFTIELMKADQASFIEGTGTKAELAEGWYSYTGVVADADTVGQLAFRVTEGTVEDLDFSVVVEKPTPLAEERTYRVISSVDSSPIEGVTVIIAADAAYSNAVWRGVTDMNGYAKDTFNNNPWLDPGTYYILRTKAGYTFDQDVENWT